MEKLFYRSIIVLVIILSLHIFFRDEEMKIIQAVGNFMQLGPIEPQRASYSLQNSPAENRLPASQQEDTPESDPKNTENSVTQPTANKKTQSP
jgi:hypothetical protein